MRGVIAIVALIFCACAAVATTELTKQGALSDDLAVDLYVCERWSRHSDSPNQVHMPYLRQCMAGRGWQETAAAAR